jgi:hypothetical protein
MSVGYRFDSSRKTVNAAFVPDLPVKAVIQKRHKPQFVETPPEFSPFVPSVKSSGYWDYSVPYRD